MFHRLGLLWLSKRLLTDIFLFLFFSLLATSDLTVIQSDLMEALVIGQAKKECWPRGSEQCQSQSLLPDFRWFYAVNTRNSQRRESLGKEKGQWLFQNKKEWTHQSQAQPILVVHSWPHGMSAIQGVRNGECWTPNTMDLLRWLCSVIDRKYLLGWAAPKLGNCAVCHSIYLGYCIFMRKVKMYIFKF